MTRSDSWRRSARAAWRHVRLHLLSPGSRIAVPVALCVCLSRVDPGTAEAQEVLHQKLGFSTIGVYGIGIAPSTASSVESFDCCDINLPKMYYFNGNKEEQNLSGRIRVGKINIPIIYPYDRISHARPMAEYIANTDVIMKHLEPDSDKITAVVLNEEDVLSNHGLDILNSLYDHIKGHYPLAVYQWMQETSPPPALKADGWVIDPYGCGREEFRRLLMKYLVTGKPVIDCILASPYRDAPLEPKSRWQVEACREFNVPMFFYCVYDPQAQAQGSAYAWLSSDAPEIVQCRQWFFNVVKEAHTTGAALRPLPTANRSSSQGIKVAGDSTDRYRYQEDFSRTKFVDHAAIDGFLNLRWEAAEGVLRFEPRPGGKNAVTLTYQFHSGFEMRRTEARLLAQTTGASTLHLSLSSDGHTWKHRSTALGDKAEPKHAVLCSKDKGFRGKEFWVRIEGRMSPDAWVALDDFEVTCEVMPPPQREIILRPDPEGNVSYRDDFQSQDYLHVGYIENQENLFWTFTEHEGGNLLGVRGIGEHVIMREKFVVTVPVANIRISMRSFANYPSLDSFNNLAVSLDGKEKLMEESTKDKKGDAQGSFRGTLTLDLTRDPRFHGVREFWVHMEMRGGGRMSSESSPTNVIHGLQVEALAEP